MPRFDLSNYVDVQTRITQFWADHPEGRIVTHLMSDPDDREHAIFRCDVYRTSENFSTAAASGWAQEIKGPQGANQTSHLENAETSAIGRALANLGYATSLKDRPSREEMGKVVRHGGTPVTQNQAPTGDLPNEETILSTARYNKPHDQLTASEKKTIKQWSTSLTETSRLELLPLLHQLSNSQDNDQLNAVAMKLANTTHKFLTDPNVQESGKTHRARLTQ